MTMVLLLGETPRTYPLSAVFWVVMVPVEVARTISSVELPR